MTAGLPVFYGDLSRHAGAAELVETARIHLEAAQSSSRARRDHLVSALILAGACAQGLADAVFARSGEDRIDPCVNRVMSLACMAARLVMGWRDRRWEPAAMARARAAFEAVEGLPGEPLNIRLAEGFAFYDLRPEAYGIAARRATAGQALIIGLRSIGTSLAAMAAAAIGADTPFTFRPTGHPFERRLALEAELRRRIAAGSCPILVADEGPGISGSSFAAVPRLLEEEGAAPERAVFLTGHGRGPGLQADAEVRRLWSRARQVPAGDETSGWDPVLRGLAGLLGDTDIQLRDISGGQWRAAFALPPADWPPCDPVMERRKAIVTAGSRRWILRFAGLGEEGLRKHERARRLAAAGLGPAPVGAIHGYLVLEWIGGSPLRRPLAADVIRAARYLGWRARALAQSPWRGAEAGDLVAMAEHNIGLVAGTRAATRLLSPARRTLSAEAERICAVDGKMERWEWLRTPDGGLIKTDALDHDSAHDLVGPRDLAWDVAGLGIEWDLVPEAEDRARVVAGREGEREVSPALVAAFRPCYLGHRIGAALLGRLRAEEAGEPEETRRHDRRLDRLVRKLAEIPL